MDNNGDKECAREGAFAFWESQAPASLQEIGQNLARAWHLMLLSRNDQALTVVDALERQLDDLPPTLAMRYRAASNLLRFAVLSFQDDSIAVLAIVISKLFAKEGMELGALLTEALGQTVRSERAERSSPSGSWEPIDGGDAISVREREVLSMISQGYSNKRIARTLNLSPETVKSHVKRIFLKLSVSTRTEAVSQAVLRGFPIFDPGADRLLVEWTRKGTALGRSSR